MADKIHIEPFMIIGVCVRTTNENSKSSDDLMQLWQQFFVKNITALIDNKVDDSIYSIYTDYDTDFRSGYTAMIGHKVSSIQQPPFGLVAREFAGGDYLLFKAKGEMPAKVIETWRQIWANDDELNRQYSTDFEVYKNEDPTTENKEVDIFIAVK